jgi:flagellar basal body-associated protein FliL
LFDWGGVAMPKTADGRIALVALIAIAVWLLIGLPLIYLPAGAGFWGWLSKDASGFFTFLLLIVGAAQLVLFWYQLRLIRISLEDTKMTAIAAADAATASSRQADAAEQSLAKIERPYIFVHSVSALHVDKIDGFGRVFYELRVTYSVANHGKIPAIIGRPQVSLSVSPEPRASTNLSYDHPLFVSPVLAPGEVRTGIEETHPWYGEVYLDGFGKPWPRLDEQLWFWAIIPYRGPFTDHHETRLCLLYDQDTNRFMGPFGHPERTGED